MSKDKEKDKHKIPLFSTQDIPPEVKPSNKNQVKSITMTAPAEIHALMAGTLSPENETKALDILSKRLDYEESQRDREYKSYKEAENKKFIIRLICIVFLFLVILMLAYCLQWDLIKLLIGGVIGFAAGYGTKQKQQL